MISDNELYSTRVPVNVTSLPKGLYQVCVIDENENHYTIKLIRE